MYLKMNKYPLSKFTTKVVIPKNLIQEKLINFSNQLYYTVTLAYIVH
jgi:hypothetical protein